MYREIIDYRKLGASKKRETVVAIPIVLLNGNPTDKLARNRCGGNDLQLGAWICLIPSANLA